MVQNVKVIVTYTGTLCFNGGDIRLGQDRRIWIINKGVTKEDIVGQFTAKLPDKFDLWGGDAASRKAVAEMLKKGKEMAAKKKPRK